MKLENIIKDVLSEQEEENTPQVQNISRLKQVLKLDQKGAEALRKAAVTGLKPNPTTNALLGDILLKMLTLDDDAQLLKIFNAIKTLKVKK